MRSNIMNRQGVFLITTVQIFILFSILLFCACSGGSGGSDTSPSEDTNSAPQVNAGEDQTISLPTNSVQLNATATDDGLPAGSALTYTWAKQSGPGNVTFNETNGLQSTATFDSAGNYVLQLAVSDSDLSTSDTVTIIVRPEDQVQTNDIELGMNLASFNDWSPAWVFVDRMKNARDWVCFGVGTTEWGNAGVKFNTGNGNVDENGYPLEIPYDPDGEGGTPPQQAQTLAFRTHFYPAGEYTLIFEGEGSISLSFDATGVFTTPNFPHSFEITTPSDSGLLVQILESTRGNHIKNIRIIMPDYEGIDFVESYETQIFHPLYLERVGIFSALRFGWWGQVWGNMTSDWSEVVTPDHFSQAGDSGVSPEHMIQLCNRIGADPWIGIPHTANDDYVRELAILVRDKMAPGRKVYIEYSNEVWNGMMVDHTYVQDQGEALGLSTNRFKAGLFWYARRSAEVFQIFHEVINDDSRIVRVVGSQAANSWTGRQVLEGLNDPSINPTSQRADALAIAPYFGGSIGDDIAENGEINSITVDEILNRLETTVYTKTETWTKANHLVSEEFNVDLIAYEGGPHLVANGSNRDNETLVNKLIEANRSPRMKEIITEMFNVWFGNGGKLFVGFDFIETPSKYGSFGILEYQEQPISEAPKYSAYYDYLVN